MKWSKLKKCYEFRLAPELRGRIKIHVTAYRPHRRDGRGWILFDGNEIVTTEAPGFLYSIAGHRFYNTIRGGELTELGYSCGQLLNLSSRDAERSDDPYIRGLFALEKRCGRRTLQRLRASEKEPFAKLLMGLRAFAMGLPVEPFYCEDCGQQILPATWLSRGTREQLRQALENARPTPPRREDN
jgi:hypothetical protein